MHISKIKLNNFRNYEEQEVELNNNINIFYGNNAQGKTNLLEAIYLCAIGKSYRTNRDKELVKEDKRFLTASVEYEKKDREGKISVSISEKKIISVNDIKIKKMSEVLGNINVVLFNPDDINIFKEGPSKRRKILDVMISQLRPSYIYNLTMYNKVLEQRNNYLRQIKLENKKEDMLDIWDEKLCDYAKEIYNYRKEFIEKIKEKIYIIHSNITQGKEELKIKYITDCQDIEKYKKELKNTRKKDIEKGYTTKGIHRDDIYFFINKKQVNIYGSQGQNRTVILSLKLSELEIMKDEIGEFPILLLDDFMSELDEKRRYHILKNINNTQILITCTNELTIEDKMCKKFIVNKGKVEKV